MSIQCRVWAVLTFAGFTLGAAASHEHPPGQKSGHAQEASGYYRTLLKNCPEANGALARLLEPARGFAKTRSSSAK